MTSRKLLQSTIYHNCCNQFIWSKQQMMNPQFLLRSYATSTTSASLPSHRNIALVANQSRERLIKWVTETQPPLSDEEVLKSVNIFMRPFAKQRIDEVRSVIDHYAAIRDPELLKKQGKVNVLDSAVSSQDREQSYLLKVFGFYNKEQILEPGIDMIWNILRKHVETYFPAKLFDSLNVSTPEKNWLNSEFYVYTFHMWALYRRLRFEGKDGEIISARVCDNFWKLCEVKMQEVGVPGGILHIELRRLQQLHYGVCIALDEGLVLGQDVDALWAEVVWKNLYASGYEDVALSPDGSIPEGVVRRSSAVTGTIVTEDKKATIVKQAVYVEAKYLVFWVRYLRYLLSWFDHMDSTMLKKGVFELHSPTSDLVQGPI